MQSVAPEGRPGPAGISTLRDPHGSAPAPIQRSDDDDDTATRSAAPHARFGWIGTGRMGTAMASRLVRAGHDVTVYNRTRSKTEPLAALGALVVPSIGDLADRDVVFITVASSDDLLGVLDERAGLRSATRLPRVVVDCSTVSEEASAEARRVLGERNVAFLAAPVSGNPKVAAAGKLTMAVSGPRDAFEEVLPFLHVVAREATYVGDGDLSRLVKLCHNLLLGVVFQSLVEVTLLAEKGGVARRDFLSFLNDSVMGSMFTRYKTPALVNLDFKPMFTTRLLHKDFDLGLASARSLEVPMPVAGLVHELLQAAIGAGMGEEDFAALAKVLARGAGMVLESEEAQVSDGLNPLPTDAEPATGVGGTRAGEPPAGGDGAQTGSVATSPIGSLDHTSR
ncbi:MAG: NAD(P)-dependent oxidoreductase [Actinomycetota bacterium]|nr:NAD(P)-dependent oxidoreductase [Actinomycetota bacterium]